MNESSASWLLILSEASGNGNPGSMYAFPKSWHTCRFEEDIHEYETLYLTAGTIL
jgi:hypothetical protein